MARASPSETPLDAASAPITLADFKARVLEVYNSLGNAFAALDASPTNLDAALDQLPLDLQEFTVGTSFFKKPLSKEQAEYVFRGLDANQNNLLELDEFESGVGSGSLYVTTTITTVTRTSTSSTATTTTTMSITTTSTSTSSTRTLSTTASSTTTFSATTSSTTTSQTTTTASSTATSSATTSSTTNSLTKTSMTTTSTTTSRTASTTTTSHTQTTTSTSRTTTTTTHVMAQGVEQGTITVFEFRRCMLKTYASPSDAFNALEANPADVHAFTRVVRTFQPPLSQEQARYAFKGFDADEDFLLVSAEFAEGLELGRFHEPAPKPQHEPSAAPKTAIPPHVGLAYLLVAGYVTRCAFMALRLPGMFGAIASGAVFTLVAPESLLFAGDALQRLLIFLALFAAGLELSVVDLTAQIGMMAILPAAIELSAISLYGMLVLRYSVLEGIALGVALFAVGGGLVMPRMHDLGSRFSGHPLPRLVFVAAPLEAYLAFTLFGVLAGVSPPVRRVSDIGCGMAFMIALRAAASIALGIALGYVAAKLLPLRRRVKLLGRLCFTGTAVEALLLLLCAALAASSLGAPGWRCPWGAPCSDLAPLLQPELLVLNFGLALAAVLEPGELRDVEEAVGGVWLVGQLLLFGLLGADTGAAAVAAGACRALPLLAVSLAARLLGTFAATGLAACRRPCPCSLCDEAGQAGLCTDAVFWFLASLPRAAMQAVAGGAPGSRRLLAGVGGNQDLQVFVGMACKLYVIGMSLLGSVLLDAFGPSLLSMASRRPAVCMAADAQERRLHLVGWTARQRGLAANSAGARAATVKLGLIAEDDVLFEDVDAPAFPAKEAAQLLAHLTSADAAALTGVLEGSASPSGRSAGSARSSAEAAWGTWASAAGVPGSYSELSRRELGLFARGPEAEGGGGSAAGAPLVTVRRLARPARWPALQQFEADGAAMADGVARKPHSSVRL